MNMSKILGVVRHILTFGGGYLVAQGYLDEETSMQIIAGLVALVGFIWSYVSPEKKA